MNLSEDAWPMPSEKVTGRVSAAGQACVRLLPSEFGRFVELESPTSLAGLQLVFQLAKLARGFGNVLVRRVDREAAPEG